MRISTRKRVKTTQLNITPMIDVVFLLITFFMVVTEITRQDEIEDLKLPHVDASKLDERPDRGRLVINILRNGAIIIGGEKCDYTQVYKKLYLEAAEQRTGPGGISDRVVLVKADERVEFKYIRKIIELCVKREIKIWRLAFGTEPIQPKEEEKEKGSGTP